MQVSESTIVNKTALILLIVPQCCVKMADEASIHKLLNGVVCKGSNERTLP